MIQCTCAGLASHCGKAKKLIDSLWLGGYKFNAYETSGDGDCCLRSLFPGEDPVHVRKRFTEYLRYTQL